MYTLRLLSDPTKGEDTPDSSILFLTNRNITISNRTISGTGNTIRGSNNRIMGNKNRVVGNANLLYGRGCISEGEGNTMISVPLTVPEPPGQKRRLRLVLFPRRVRQKKDPFREISDAKGNPVQNDEEDGGPPCTREKSGGKCPECDRKIAKAEIVYP